MTPKRPRRSADPELPRWSRQMQTVMDLMGNDREWYGAQLSAASGIPSGTLYPILTRLTSLGVLTARWEDVDTRVVGRPRRRYYRRVRKLPVNRRIGAER